MPDSNMAPAIREFHQAEFSHGLLGLRTRIPDRWWWLKNRLPPTGKWRKVTGRRLRYRCFHHWGDSSGLHVARIELGRAKPGGSGPAVVNLDFASNGVASGTAAERRL